MARTCTICSHKQRLEIEALLASRKPYREITGKYGVSDSAISRHVKDCIPSALEALRQQQKAKAGLVVEEEVQRVFRRLNKLIDSCDEWLTDPLDAEKYTLEPRDAEIQVVYLDHGEPDANGNPKRKRDSLRALLARVEAANVEAVHCESKSADPRGLVVKTAAQIANQLELYGKLLGLFQKPRDNDRDVERREQELEDNRKWARSLVQNVKQKLKLNDEEAVDWVRENVPTASQWIQ